MNTYLIEIKEKSDNFETIGVLTNLLKVYMKDGVINHFRVTELTAQKNIKEQSDSSASPVQHTKAKICPHYGKEIVNRYTGESEVIHRCRCEGKQ